MHMTTMLMCLDGILVNPAGVLVYVLLPSSWCYTIVAGVLHQIVPSTRPQEGGLYWGYKVRYAPNLSSVIENCPFEVRMTISIKQLDRLQIFFIPAYANSFVFFCRVVIMIM